MKIVKRDGRIVDYNKEKIVTAIQKANNELDYNDRISLNQIDEIIRFIESQNKKRMLVEEIQDIIEEKLMEFGKFTLAKKYIIYRYTRSIIRKSNTTDATILNLLKNSENINEKCITAAEQRNIMAGEASKDLANRLLLPKNVVDAQRKGYILVSNLEHFTESIIESSFVNIKDIFLNGTTINGIKIDSPKSFQSACNILIEVIIAISNYQTGNIYVDFNELFPFYELSYQKNFTTYKTLLSNNLDITFIDALAKNQTFMEVKSGLQTIIYQLNTLSLSETLTPKLHFIIDTTTLNEEIYENILFEFISQLKLSNKNLYPKLIYVLNNSNDVITKKHFYITEELYKSNLNAMFVNSTYYTDFRSSITKFNQGTIYINLAKIVLQSLENGLDIYDAIEKNLDICYEAILCRNHNLLGTFSDKSPSHWKFGAITRLKTKEKIDYLLKSNYSYLNLCLIGLSATYGILKDEQSINKINSIIIDCTKAWNLENSFEVKVSNCIEHTLLKKLYMDDYELANSYSIKNYEEDFVLYSDNYLKSNLLYFDFSSNSILDLNIINNHNFIFIKTAENKNSEI